jgi:hypothetical protein
VAGAVGALYGPLHGGANEAVLKMLARIGNKEAIPGFLEVGPGGHARVQGGFLELAGVIQNLQGDYGAHTGGLGC